MKLPNQAQPVMRNRRDRIQHSNGFEPSGCSTWKSIRCIAQAAACVPVCAAGGAGCLPCLIGIGAADCLDCL
jgi:hypothetical protein